MVDKTLVFNIALSALRLNQQTVDPDNDHTKAVKQLSIIYPLALSNVLADLDLNKTSTKVKLELLNKEHPHWKYVYKYPVNCAKFRRIVSGFRTDNKNTRIPSATENIDDIDVILTNEPEAYADIIKTTVNLSSLSSTAAMALGHMMAYMSPNQIIGKGAGTIKQSIFQDYVIYKTQAQQYDQNENVDTTPDEFNSEFIQARLGCGRWHTND